MQHFCYNLIDSSFLWLLCSYGATDRLYQKQRAWTISVILLLFYDVNNFEIHVVEYHFKLTIKLNVKDKKTLRSNKRLHVIKRTKVQVEIKTNIQRIKYRQRNGHTYKTVARTKKQKINEHLGLGNWIRS